MKRPLLRSTAFVRRAKRIVKSNCSGSWRFVAADVRRRKYLTTQCSFRLLTSAATDPGFVMVLSSYRKEAGSCSG